MFCHHAGFNWLIALAKTAERIGHPTADSCRLASDAPGSIVDHHAIDHAIFTFGDVMDAHGKSDLDAGAHLVFGEDPARLSGVNHGLAVVVADRAGRFLYDESLPRRVFGDRASAGCCSDAGCGSAITIVCGSGGGLFLAQVGADDC